MKLVLSTLLTATVTLSGAAQTKPSKPNAPATEKPGAAKAAPATKPESAPKAENAETKSAAEAKLEAEAELTAAQQRGLGLIAEAAQEAAGFTDKRSGALIQAQAADLLWKHDAPSARELFEKAFEQAIQYYHDSKDTNQQQVGANSFVGRSDVRLDVVRLAGRHDAELGKRLTERYVTDKKREAEERQGGGTENEKRAARFSERMYGAQDPAAGDLLSAARTLLETDPKTAFELVRRAFANSVPQNAPPILPTLAAKDRTATDAIYSAALARLANSPEAAAGQLLLLSAYPFGEKRVWVSNGESSSSFGFDVPKEAQPDPALIARFLTTAASVLAKAAELNPAQVPDHAPRIATALFTARLLEPKVAQYQPALLEAWRVAFGRLSALTEEAARTRLDRTLEDVARENVTQAGGNNAANAGTDRVQDAVERAEKAKTPQERDDYLADAATQASRQQEFERAITLTGRISDVTYRTAVRSWISFDAANHAIKEKRYDEARKHALDVEVTDQRAYLFFQIASTAFKDKDRVRATELLEEATRNARAADNSAGKARALLGLANLYATLDFVRGFEVVADAVKTINQVADFNPEQRSLVRLLQRQNGQGSNVSTFSVEAFDLGQTLSALARTDFERALGLAQSVEQKPLKYKTVIALATTLFEPKRLAQNP